MLNFIQRETRFLGNRLETHSSVVHVALKYRLDESHQTNLLSKESVVFLEDWEAEVSTKFKETSQRPYLFGEQGGKSLKFADVPFIEGKQ